MTENRPHSVSVAGIVVNDEGKVLVIRRRDNGHREPLTASSNSTKRSKKASAGKSTKKPESGLKSDTFPGFTRI